MHQRLGLVTGWVERGSFAFLAGLLGALSACTSDLPIETTSKQRDALSATAARVLGLDQPSDWSASGATLASGARHIQGTGSLAVSNLTYATVTSRVLSTLGANEIGSFIGFDVQIPEFQPNPNYFGAVQLYIDIPSRGILNAFVGQKDLTHLPRESFRRVEIPLPPNVQSALRSTYSDLRVRVVLNTPGGTEPYLLDRISFRHEESEAIDDSHNAAILGFESDTAWLAAAGSTAMSTNRTERKLALSVTPSGWTVITSDRLATPAVPEALVGFDLKMPRVGENPGWLGETQLYVELPSQGIYNQYVGRHELSLFEPDAYNRVSYTLPANIVSKLGEPFDDLRFKIVFNTPPGMGPFLADRFRFGDVKDPTETVEHALPFPRNVGPSDLALLATEALTLGPRVRALAGTNPLLAVAALGSGGVNLGAGSEVDSVVSYGPVNVAAGARVRGYIGGARELSADPSALIWGEIIAERAPLESSSFQVSFGPTTADVFVGGESSTMLEPGRYRNVSVTGGVLRLQPEHYAFDRLMVAPGGSIEYDSRSGSPFVAVRTAMDLRGTTRDRAIDAGFPPFGAPTFAYMGGDALVFSGAPPGRVVAPRASVRVTLPPSGADTPIIWGVVGRLIEVIADPTGSNAFGLGPARSRLPPLGPGFPGGRSATVSANGTYAHVAEASSQNEPLVVFKDNPWWHGSFDWRAGESASNGCPPWFVGGTWHGIDRPKLTLLRLRPAQSPAQAWIGPLLPGHYFGSIPNTDPCTQTPDTWPQAFFTTRAFNLWHGATFRVTPTLPDGGLLAPSSVYTRLSDEILVVPLVVIHWDSETFLDDMGALFDFMPSEEYPPDGQPPLSPPLGPNPGTIDFPPDEIWNQCGIQFQIVKALHLGPPEGTDLLGCSNDGNSCPTFGEPCGCNRDEAMPDYARNDVLSARLHSALGAEFDEIFGSGGLNPILVQLGTPACVRLGRGPNLGECQYAGKAAVGTVILSDVVTRGVVQINKVLLPAATTSHELGHILMPDLPFPNGHSPDLEDLMHAVGPGRRVPPSQCAMARELAAGLSRSYFTYNRLRGRTDTISLPDPRTRFPGAVTPGSPSKDNQLVCCDVGSGRRVETLAGRCAVMGRTVTGDCTVCCNASDVNFEQVDHNACEPGDVVPADECLSVCCALEDREETITAGECVARDGEPNGNACQPVCCEIDGTPQDLTRGECARQGGEEVIGDRCGQVP